MKTLIKNGLLVDPADRIKGKLNLLIEDGSVVVVTGEEPEAGQVIDGRILNDRLGGPVRR